MKKLALLIILGCSVLTGRSEAAVPPPPSDWPSLNADASQSNYNRLEKTLSAKNILKLKVKWTAPIADASYPVVAGGRVYLPFVNGSHIYVRALDAVTGKPVGRYSKDASGGLLWDGGSLYVAGKSLQDIDPPTGGRLARIDAPANTRIAGSRFIYPLADKKVVIAGFASGIHSSIYTVDSESNTVRSRLPSASAIAAVTAGRIVTRTSNGSVFYDESTGRAIAHPPYIGSSWFTSADNAYTVASAARHPTTLYAFDKSGHQVWHRTVGPALALEDFWPHAVGTDAVFVQTLKPAPSVEAVGQAAGNVLWRQPLANVNQIVLANDLLLALSYGLGLPTRLFALNPRTGKIIGAVVLSAGYFGFWAPNGLMVADGEVFIRVAGPRGSQLIALGL